MQLRAWDNGDAIYPNGELGRVVIRNIKLWNKKRVGFRCIEFLHIDVWTLGDSQMKNSCR